jgi:ribose-phosphate pyrophosphokinase
MDRLVLLTGNANRPFAERVSAALKQPLGNATVQRFPDGEVEVKVHEDVRGADVFVIQPTCPPVNESLMELLILIDCLRRASAGRITAVIPYFGYARQDRKAEGRVPISAKLVANLISTAGADRVLTMDLHAPQIQGFFDIPLDHLYSLPVMLPHFQGRKDIVMVGPDLGAAQLARSYAKRLGCEVAFIDKRRLGPAQTEVNNVVGNVEGRHAILVDDIIATGGSIVNAGKACLAHGATGFTLCATHAVFVQGAAEKLAASGAHELVVTDSIPVTAKMPNLKVLSAAPLFAEAIRRTHTDASISELFMPKTGT